MYNPLGLPLDPEAMLEMTEKQLGRALFAYRQPFTAPDGPEIFAGVRGESVGGIARGG
jgi:hypothetical protein